MHLPRLLIALAVVTSGLSFGACSDSSPTAGPGNPVVPGPSSGFAPSGGGGASTGSGYGYTGSGYGGYGGSGYGGSGYGGSGYGGYGGSGSGYGGYGGSGSGYGGYGGSGSGYGGYGGSGSGYGGYGGSGSGYGGYGGSGSGGYGGYGGSGSGAEPTVSCGAVECATSAFYCLEDAQSQGGTCAFYPQHCAHALSCACLVASQPSCTCSEVGNGGFVVACQSVQDE